MSAGEYVAAAYVVVLAAVLVYVVIMALKVERLQREVSELVDVLAREPRRDTVRPRDEAPLAESGAAADRG